MNGLEGEGIILFVGEGCKACNEAKPIYHQFFGNKNQEYVIINARDEIELAQALNIRSIPTLLLFKDGKEWRRLIGAPALESLKENYDEWVA